MISPCSPLPQPVAALSRHASVRPTHRALLQRVRNAVRVGRHARAVVASGCRVISPLATGIILGVLPPASAFHRQMAPPIATQRERPADPATEESGSAPAFSPMATAMDDPSDTSSSGFLSGPFVITFAPATGGSPPTEIRHFSPLAADLRWPGQDGLDPGTSLPHPGLAPGGLTPGEPPELIQPVTSDPVSEPSSLFILGAGLCGIIMLDYRRRGVAQPQPGAARSQ